MPHERDHLRARARLLDGRAEIWRALAADCDRWGLSSDAAEARRQMGRARVEALTSRARAAALGASSAGFDELPR